jgi:hypothetical protein
MVKKFKAQEDEALEAIQEDYESLKNKMLRKKPWSEEEDTLVKKLVEKYGPQRWSFIAKFVPGRLGKQCR